jgi:hypothetical protein
MLLPYVTPHYDQPYSRERTRASANVGSIHEGKGTGMCSDFFLYSPRCLSEFFFFFSLYNHSGRKKSSVYVDWSHVFLCAKPAEESNDFPCEKIIFGESSLFILISLLLSNLMINNFA